MSKAKMVQVQKTWAEEMYKLERQLTPPMEEEDIITKRDYSLYEFQIRRACRRIILRAMADIRKRCRELIDIFVPRGKTGRLRDSMKWMVDNTYRQDFPFILKLATPGVWYASVVNNMPTEWLTHGRDPHAIQGWYEYVIERTKQFAHVRLRKARREILKTFDNKNLADFVTNTLIKIVI